MAYDLIEGDCLTVLPTLPVASVDVVIADFPYNEVNRPSGGLRGLDKGVADSAPVDIPAAGAALLRVARGSLYLWCGFEQVSAWVGLLRAAGLTTRVGVWHKTNPSPMNGTRLWLSAVELCVFARRPRAPFYRRCAPPVWTGPTERVEGFPCPKPVWLMTELIEASCPPGGVVLDPVMGSGSTGVAAVRAGRRFIGIEREAPHLALARTRLERLARS